MKPRPRNRIAADFDSVYDSIRLRNKRLAAAHRNIDAASEPYTGSADNRADYFTFTYFLKLCAPTSAA
jgi:hypothetical protein